jgi:hypothetical protein
MLVQELIDLLSQCDPNLPVYVDGDTEVNVTTMQCMIEYVDIS